MKEYFKTFSIRELLTSIFSGLMLVSLYVFLRQIELYDDYYILAFFSLTLPVALGHRLYFLEHKRRNRLFGRVFQNLITSAFTFVLFIIVLKVGGVFYEIGSYGNLAIAVIFLMFLTELILTLINKIFLLLRWQIW